MVILTTKYHVRIMCEKSIVYRDYNGALFNSIYTESDLIILPTEGIHILYLNRYKGKTMNCVEGDFYDIG